MMDVEAGRCRRTDGRKWRCSKSVVPNQKYCEGHMNRGRQGSRKHVEATPSVSNNNGTSMISYVMDTRLAVYDKCDFKQCCSYSNSVNCTSTEDRVGSWLTRKEVNKNANVGVGITSMDSGVSHTEGKNSEFENVNSTKSSRRKQSVTKSNYMGLVSPSFDLSPKSGAGKLGSENVRENDRQRCRRTDGKKWQCKQDAVAGQKYCEAHMHRGAKRLMVNLESVGCNALASTSHSDHVSSPITKCLDNGINLNTIPASPEGSSPSDATTITDENISYARM